MAGLQADLDLALTAAYAAGRTVMKYFGADLVIEHKAPDQPLTEADLAADAELHEHLIGRRPEYGWLSEETRDRPDRLDRQRVWIVDPIDGTRSFIAGCPEFAISIGLVDAGQVVAGVVYNPARDHMFYAIRGAGSFSLGNGGTERRLAVSTPPVADQLTMLASRSEIAAGEFDPFRGGWHIEPAGSTAYKLACIAAAAGEAFVSRGPKSEWDICAGALLVAEAGGRVSDVTGRTPRFNCADPYVHGIIATNTLLHDALVRQICELPVPERLRRRSRDPLHPGLKEEAT
jgi:myo-inositol-1(or 4)-monophosphatase